MKGLEICILDYLIIFTDFKPQITKIIEILVHFRFIVYVWIYVNLETSTQMQVKLINSMYS